MNLSHRLRLTMAAMAATGIVLAGLFIATIFFARRDVLGDKRVELAAVMRSLTPSSDPHFDLAEFEETHPEMSAAVFDSSGRLLTKSGRLPPHHGQGFSVRENRLELGTIFKGEDVVLSLDLLDSKKGVDRLAATLAGIWLPLTLLVGGATWAAAQSVFRPLDRLSAQALAMGGANLSERLATGDRAEFGAFAERLNGMLDRVEETVRRGERFSTDAAHELRTPLALLRTRLETSLLQTRSPGEYEATIRRCVLEIDRLTSVTEALLRSARGEVVPSDPVDLQPLVQEAGLRWEERFASRGVLLEVATVSASASILPDEIRVVLDNLLDNALRYAPEGSKVIVRVAAAGAEVRLSVRDQGPGIPAEVGQRVFDRFVRADDSRNRASGGAGIGLAVCRQIVSGRGGRMFLAPGGRGGVEVGCVLPTQAF